jgi:hypothetical protein
MISRPQCEFVIWFTFRDASLDHIVGGNEQHWRYLKPERPGGFEIDQELVFGRLLQRQLAWFFPAQNAIDRGCICPLPGLRPKFNFRL